MFWNKCEKTVPDAKEVKEKLEAKMEAYADLTIKSPPPEPEPDINTWVTATTTIPAIDLGGTWSPEIETSEKKFIEAVTASLEDNMVQNKGNLKLNRSLIEAVIESAILKSEIKLVKDKNINEITSAVCDKLIAVDSPETNLPAVLVSMSEITTRIYREVSRYKEETPATQGQAASAPGISGFGYYGTTAVMPKSYIATVKED